MKIEKGYTLSQFVDLYHMQWANVRKYNEFLKQPLSKEMFINEIPFPKNPGTKYMAGWEDHHLEWEKSESKVIFDGWNKYDTKDMIVFISEDKYTTIELYKNNKSIYTNERGIEHVIENIGQLFEVTKGELKIKNVEL